MAEEGAGGEEAGSRGEGGGEGLAERVEGERGRQAEARRATEG